MLIHATLVHPPPTANTTHSSPLPTTSQQQMCHSVLHTLITHPLSPSHQQTQRQPLIFSIHPLQCQTSRQKQATTSNKAALFPPSIFPPSQKPPPSNQHHQPVHPTAHLQPLTYHHLIPPAPFLTTSFPSPITIVPPIQQSPS